MAEARDREEEIKGGRDKGGIQEPGIPAFTMAFTQEDGRAELAVPERLIGRYCII